MMGEGGWPKVERVELMYSCAAAGDLGDEITTYWERHFSALMSAGLPVDGDTNLNVLRKACLAHSIPSRSTRLRVPDALLNPDPAHPAELKCLSGPNHFDETTWRADDDVLLASGKLPGVFSWVEALDEDRLEGVGKERERFCGGPGRSNEEDLWTPNGGNDLSGRKGADQTVETRASTRSSLALGTTHLVQERSDHARRLAFARATLYDAAALLADELEDTQLAG